MKSLNKITKITAVSLSALMLCSGSVSALAASTSSEKEEVIYVMTDASGNVTDVEAVNIFAGGEITDYGDYSEVKLLNTNDTITQDADKTTFSTEAEKVYYQGTMKNTVIPWNISIRYFLDGKEISADELAGKTGALEIHFSVSKNESCKGSFYDGYALQASFTLDTGRCANIMSTDATVANVGSDKQITYTILPGKGIDTVISADVTDFEMEAAAINGVRMNLNIEVNDSDLMDRVDEIKTAVSDLDDGASTLNDGMGELYDATKTLNKKVGELDDGAGALKDGADSLSSGLSTITGKSSQLNLGAYAAYEGLCSAAASALNAQLAANGMETVTLTPSNYSSVLHGLLEKMDADTVYNQAYQTALQKVTEAVNANENSLYQAYIQSQENSIYIAYLSSTTQAESLYTAAAKQAVYTKALEEQGEDRAKEYLSSYAGQQAVLNAVNSLTEEEKTQILNSAASQLSDDQKNQILQAALQNLTVDQKAQIKAAYVDEMMKKPEVTSQISAAVTSANAAAGQISNLIGQLDSFGTFISGLSEYTSAVQSASDGANTIKENLDTLYSGTGTLSSSVGKLNDAVKELYDGTGELKDGTGEFVSETANIDTEISDEIDSLISSVTGGNIETVSFVSEKNTNVDSVQFVIKTAAIEEPDQDTVEMEEEATLNFWQKLLNLFGLY